MVGFDAPAGIQRPTSARRPRASPKAISGRTSYLRVRLEFLRYPPLLPALFNGRGCGPPPPSTAASAWARVGHPVSGPRGPTHRPLQTRSPCGSAPSALSLAGSRGSPDRSTKSTRSGLPSVRLATPSHRPWARGFRLSFTPLPGSFSPFPRGTPSLSVTSQYPCLGGWSPLLPAGFHVPCGTPDHARARSAPRTGRSPSPAGRPRPFRSPRSRSWRSTPRRPRWGRRFGQRRFRSPLLTASPSAVPGGPLISLPPPT